MPYESVKHSIQNIRIEVSVSPSRSPKKKKNKNGQKVMKTHHENKENSETVICDQLKRDIMNRIFS